LKVLETPALKTGVAEKDRICCPIGRAAILFCARRREGDRSSNEINGSRKRRVAKLTEVGISSFERRRVVKRGLTAEGAGETGRTALLLTLFYNF
jgi:hypothetical protein